MVGTSTKSATAMFFSAQFHVPLQRGSFAGELNFLYVFVFEIKPILSDISSI